MSKPAIIVHGGCGRVDEVSLSERLDGVKKAAETGWQILRIGGSAVDAVESAIVVLENIPLFNAGCGSVLNSEGRVETDAAIMNGATSAAGAIAGVTGILNPIQLARRVMDVGPHVMMIGDGAERYARSHGFVQHDMEQLVAGYRRKEWEREHGTVGATACDQRGLLVAATSTGGCTNKLPGRVGDTPIIGCGTYANDRVAISCTGNGEHIIRMTLARLAAFRHEQCGNVWQASSDALAQLESKLGGEVGLILVDFNGKTAYAKNTLHMPVCAINQEDINLCF